MDVLDLILSPFFFVVEQLFLLGHRLTGNNGLAILFLSFGISLLLLPIFILIERAKKRDDAVKQKMKPVLDEIKRCYRGQERYYYIRTLQRQHGYSAFRALIPVLTLLLQIPFFIAAYQFLEHYEPLAGQGFLFIDDLSTPDRLLGGINLLPILMTIVNLVTAYFYTRNGNTGERRQMLVVAAIFLVLLYNFPSGLVLYWTMNNVFSFFRLFVTNPEVFRKREKKSVSGWTGSRIKHTLVQLRTGSEKIQVQPWIFFSLFFLTLYFFVAGKLYFAEDNQTLLTFSIVTMVLTQVVGFLYFYRAGSVQNQTLNRILSLVMLCAILFQVGSAYFFFSGPKSSMSLFNMHIAADQMQLTGMIYPGLLFSFITLPFYIKQQGIRLAKQVSLSPALFLLSAAYIAGFISLWNPLSVYASFPETFNFSALQLIGKNLPVFLILLLIATSLFYITPRRFRWLLVAIALTTVAISFVHNTILPIKMGTLQENKFEKEQALLVPPFFYLVEGIAMIALFMAGVFVVVKKYGKQVIYGLALLNIVIVSQSLYSAVSSGNFVRNDAKIKNSSHRIPFSKTKRNVVYLIPDMFQGWAMHRMMDENPELKAQLDGFVWYPNALAISRVTNTSVGPLLGGHAYAPDSLDLDTERTIQEKLSQAKCDLSDKVRQQGYSFTSTRITYTNIDNKYYDIFLPEWTGDWDVYNKQLGIRVTEEIDYTLLQYNALFFSAPLALKPKIYNQGQWLFPKRKKKGRNTTTSLKHQFLRLLPYISDADADQGNFVMIYSMVSHFPWSIVDENGSMINDVSPYENDKWVIETLVQWFNWMKENDVYDNTRIVLVSDHGTHWKRFNRELDIDNPFKNVDDESVPLNYMLDLNPLIMVKDFDAKEPFSEDWQFMSNMDAIDIALGERDPAREPFSATRELPAFVSWWTRDMNNRTHFSLEHKYIVKKSIFDADNWTMVWDKNLGDIEPENEQESNP